MRSFTFLCVVFALACGPTETPVASSTTPTLPAVTPPIDPTPPAEPERPVEAPSSLPDDFAMLPSGGPTMTEMAANMTLNHTELRPGATAGTFEMVEVAVLHDGMGMAGERTDVRRAPAPRERVEAIYQYATTNMTALEASCVDPTIMDGATARLVLTYGGERHTFSCTNARSPEFSQLEGLFNALSNELLPAPPPT